jgi:hypothetical protein
MDKTYMDLATVIIDQEKSLYCTIDDFILFQHKDGKLIILGQLIDSDTIKYIELSDSLKTKARSLGMVVDQEDVPVRVFSHIEIKVLDNKRNLYLIVEKNIVLKSAANNTIESPTALGVLKSKHPIKITPLTKNLTQYIIDIGMNLAAKSIYCSIKFKNKK